MDTELEELRAQAYQYLNAKRIPHVAGCEQEAEKLALRWGEDPCLAAKAGILHDITKRNTYSEHLELCDKYKIDCDEAELAEPKLLHAKTGAALAEHVFHMPQKIVEAIRWHTTGKPDMTLLEKILYLADYIEPTRNFEGVETLRKLAYENIDLAMARALQMSLDDLYSRGIEPFCNSIDACSYYKQLTEKQER